MSCSFLQDGAGPLLRELFTGDLVFQESMGNLGQRVLLLCSCCPVAKLGSWLDLLLNAVCSMQAGYEVAPDEKRKECGQHLIEKYLKPNVSKRVVFAACNSRAVVKLTAVIALILPQRRCWAGW